MKEGLYYQNKKKEMSLEEKVAQLKGIWLHEVIENDEISLEKCREKIPFGIGHVCQFACTNAYSADKLARLVYDLQQYLLKETRTQIPALFHEEVITGIAARGATVTPQMIGMACTFNPNLVYQNARFAGISTKKLGAYYTLSPMLDIITDAHWPRIEEGFGENPYLVATFADAFITGLQSVGVGATAKHYAGYGVENQSEVFFKNETLRPFEVAIRQSNVTGIMPGYHTFRDIPSTCQPVLLTDALRNHLGFEGMVVSDYGAIRQIYKGHQYTTTLEEAAMAAIQAGVDVDFPDGTSYDALIQSVKEGKLDEAWIDQALIRVLQVKSALMPEEIHLETNIDLDPKPYREAACQSARESIVLLKNDGLLPLKETQTQLLLTGPNADSYYALLGDYTWGGLAEFFRGMPVDKMDPVLYTLKDGLERHSPQNVQIHYSRGFEWTETDSHKASDGIGDEREIGANRKPLEQHPEVDFEATLEQAKKSDVIIVAVGENRYLCGEGTSRPTVTLPGNQEAYVSALCQTGKPVIMVVFGGRPMAIADLTKQCAAVLYAWYPGEEGGNACAEILWGKTTPSAKLAVTLPPKESLELCNDLSEEKSPYPFGYGMSYTTYAYDQCMIPQKVALSQSAFEISFDLSNTGNYDGAEITQIYFENEETHKRELLGFSKTFLKTGEKQKVVLQFPLELFGRYEKDLFVTKESTYTVSISRSSTDAVFTRKLSIIGNTLTKKKRTQFTSKQLNGSIDKRRISKKE